MTSKACCPFPNLYKFFHQADLSRIHLLVRMVWKLSKQLLCCPQGLQSHASPSLMNTAFPESPESSTSIHREAGVVAMRFGLTDGQPKTLDEIGKVYGVTRERIRQIESKTMSKLRHPSRSQVLRDYLD